MDYFLPSFVQKRLLRYALSRLELVDTDALDLDALGVRWGQRSSFELRDVGLKLPKLASILHLPPTCELLKARIALLRVTIPADIYSSGIVVEADGIKVHARLLSADDDATGLPTSRLHGQHTRTTADNDDGRIPTTNDLAQSFLESEPREKKAELEAAISSQSQHLQRPSGTPSDDEEEEDLGIGSEGVSLPSFIAAFLKGVVDRLQVKVTDVTSRVEMDLRQDAPIKRAPEDRPDKVAAVFTLRELSVGAVIDGASGQEEEGAGSGKVPRREISLSAIQALLVSEPVVFSNYARFTADPSPPSTEPSQSDHDHDHVLVGDDYGELSESRLFSHEEAESMYMSAMSYASSDSTPSMPGSWDTSEAVSYHTTVPAASTSASTSAVASTPANDGAPTPTIDRPDTPVVRQGSRDVGAPSAPTSPHTMSSRPVETSSEDPEVARRILDISKITVLVPTAEQPTEINEPDTPSSPVRQSPRPESADARLSASMTSSFMDSSFRATTFNLPRRSRTDSLASIRVEDFAGEVSIQESPASKPSNAIEINVEDVSVQFDIATGWLLVKVSQKVLGAFATKSDQKRPESSTTPTANKSQNLRFSLGNCSVKFLEHLIGFPYHGHHAPQNDAPVQGIILRAAISGLKADVLVINELSKLNVNLGKFVLGYASEDFISFNEDLKMRESVRDVLAPTHAELSLSIVKSPSSARATITTLPLHLNLNIQRLEEILGWFGGLSTILELGSSISSMSTVRGDEPRFSTSSRGVHFAGVPDPRPKTPQTTSSSWKVNVRLGGLVVDLVGEKCSLRLKTTAVKMVSRFEGVGLQIDKAKLSGPLSTEDDGDAPGKISFNNIRIEYLFSPKEVDLDRLLYLITPSKDKYGDDDDIMLDTLLRQRRQGSVVRVTVAAVKLIVSDTQELRLLSHLPAEIGKLSNVAKYLPDDDRPGIMTLALIREFDGQLHVDNNVGDLQVRSQDLEVAHVTLPALIAAQIKRLSLTRNGDEELVGEALQPPAEQGIGQPPLPMIMARYIADDVDPTVKVKLHNLRAEYIVSTLAAFLGLGGNSTAQEFAVGMANSVASLADLPVTHRHQTSSAPSEISRPDSTKPFRLAVASRDCVIGLNPRDMPAKGLIVLTYAKFTSVLQEDEPSELVFDIKKATLMIIDDVRNIDSPENPRRKIPGNSPQVQAFADMGYVPVTYMSSALADVKIYNTEEGNKSVDVELRDDLLILETCADSTKTLINLFNGLVPPTPPSTAVKYRTEVMPLQDMLASFTGDAYATEPVSDPEALAAVPDEDDERGIADELEYVSDFYPAGPGAAGDPEHATGLAADSSQPGHLLDSVHSEYNITLDSSVTGLEFRDDHFAKQSAVGGTAHRWDSTHNTYELTNDVKISSSPLRVRVRDVHIIWNLFDGYDWRRTRDAISKAVKDVEARAMERRARAASRLSPDEEEEESVIGDFLFNSIYIGIPANRDPRELSQAINNNIDDLASETGSYATQTTVTGATARRHSSSPSVRGKKLRLSRSKHHKMTFELQGVSADVVVFPPGSGETQSSIDVRVNNLEIFDHIPTSTWKKFATYMHDAGERESGTGMVHLEILIVRPVQELAASEIVLKATVLPLRLHVDQDALDFLSRFFEFKDENEQAPSAPGDVPFVQRAEINAVPVKLDFKPKRVDYAGLRSGRTTEFMNFFILDGADMVLRRVILYGVSGFDKLGQALNDIWMPDIKRNQLPRVLAGIAPIRSLVNVGSGFKDLVVIPMREYKKDGRIVRSIQKGAFAFAKTTTNELVKLGAKLAIGTQTVLQGAEELLTAESSRGGAAADSAGDGDSSADEDEPKQISHYADQPVGVVQGLRGAFKSLERDLLLARDAIVAVPGEVVDSGSAAGAARAVIRRAPTVILRPAIGATKAVGQTLLGAGNALDPANRRRIEDKYKRH